MPSVTALKGHHEHTPKRYRVLFNGIFIADTIDAHYVWENDHWPYAYIPLKDVQSKYLSVPKGKGEDDFSGDGGEGFKDVFVKGGKGGERVRLEVGARSTEEVFVVKEGELKDFVKFEFDEMDAWFEEETQIYVHPKDPYKRIDVLSSTRHIVVKKNGIVLAETRSPTLVFETLQPTRYYLPKSALKWEFLKGSETVTKCPYKGEAHYYSVNLNGQTYNDLSWWHKYPASESIGILGLVSFYNSEVEIYIDGVKEGN